MYYNKLRERVSYFKETKDDVAIMCRAIEEMVEKERAEERKEERTAIFTKMQEKGLSIKQIAELVDIPENEIKGLLSE